MSDAAAEMFGPYRIEELLGSGGMGEVHRAYDTEHERQVALKRLPAPAGAEFRARFRREAKIAAGLAVAHVVPIHAHGEIDGQLYLAMRLIDGSDLKRRLADGPLAPRRAVDLLSQVAAALDAAHATGVVHRDVKPANILLDSDGTAYLADFGIARSFAPDVTKLTETGAQVGTLDYMAPERLMHNDSEVGAAADVYSLACVLFQCLTGRVPFPAVDSVGKLAAQLGDPPPSPSLFDSQIPPSLDLVVRTGMDKDPRRRYPTAGELMAAAAAVTADATEVLPEPLPPANGQEDYFAELLVTVARERTAPPVRGTEPDRCPYPGLQSFGVGDSAWFFGRERAVSDLLVRLSRQRADDGPLIVVGASGAGKSSLLNAGLLATHARGAGARLALTPGEHPAGTLAARLAALTNSDANQVAWRLRARPAEFGELCRAATIGREGPLLIAVDQFEELFTQCADPVERQVFATALANAWPARVVFAVRADFVEHCITLAALRPSLAAPYVLGPLSSGELTTVITQPAEAAGLELEAGLTDRLIADVGARDAGGPDAVDPGTLPRLAHALRETWHNRSGNTLTLNGYQRTGGVDRAVALTADGVYSRLDEPDRYALRAALLRMVTLLDEGGIARRRAHRGEIPARILERLVAARLVTVDRDTVALAHDALLTAWPRLREWVAQDRQGLLIRQQLGTAAAAWQAGGQDRGDLYRGARLGAALDWAGGRGDLTPPEQAFLRASERDRRRTVRRLRGVVAGLATLLVVALAAGGVAVLARNAAERDRQTAESRRLAAESIAQSDVDPVEAMKKAVQAWREAPTTEARGALLSAPMLTYPAAVESGVDAGVSVDVSPDGSLIAAGGLAGKVVLWDVAARKPRLELDYEDPKGRLVAVRFSPDGKLIATSSLNSDAGGDKNGVRIWSVATGRLVRTLKHLVAAIGPVAWHPDGSAVAAPSVREDSSLAIGSWSPWTGAFLGWLAPTDFSVSSIAYGTDGDRLAIGHADGRLELWDPATATLVSRRTEHRDNAVDSGDDDLVPVNVAFSSELLASSSVVDNTIRLWDPRTGAPVRQVPDVTRHPDDPSQGPSTLAFTPDGSVLLTNSDAGTITAWDPISGNYLHDFAQGPRAGTTVDSSIFALAVSADGRTTVAAGGDGTVLRWQTNPNWYLKPTGSVMSLSFLSNGKSLSAGDSGGELHTWDPSSGDHTGRPAELDSGVFAIRHTRAGLRITGTFDATFTVTPIGQGTARPRSITLAGREFRGAMAVSPDGAWLAAAHQHPSRDVERLDDHQIHIWDTATLTEHKVLRLGKQWPLGLAFSPDSNRLLALTSADEVFASDPVIAAGATMLTWRAPDFTDQKSVRLGDDTLSAAVFTRRGTLITAGTAGSIQVRDGETFRVRAEFGRHPSTVRQLAVSPDGRTVATVTTDDSVVRLWDLGDQELIASLSGHFAPLNEVEFSPNGRRLASGGTDSEIAVWYTDPDDAIKRVCASLADAGEPDPDLDEIGCP